MARYPLEWGWHTDQPTETSVTAASTPTLLGGDLQRSPAEVIYDSRPRETGSKAGDPALTPVAWGDKSCSGCGTSGKRSGSTGMFEMERRILCWNCAAKAAGAQNEPSDEQVRILTPFLLQPK